MPRCPAVSFVESHPFTIASAVNVIGRVDSDDVCNTAAPAGGATLGVVTIHSNATAQHFGPPLITDETGKPASVNLTICGDDIDVANINRHDAAAGPAAAMVTRVRTQCHLRAGKAGTWTYSLKQKVIAAAAAGSGTALRFQV